MNQDSMSRLNELKRIAFPELVGKQTLRDLMRKRRRAMDSRLSLYKSKRIAERILAMKELNNASTIAMYASMPEEASTDGLAQALLQRGAALLYPVTSGDAIEFYKITSLESLSVNGAFGIREPDINICPRVAIQEADVILAPGVGFDVFGARIGFGGGYYDRLLIQKREDALVVGLAFESQVVHAVETETHDMVMDVVATDDTLYRPHLSETVCENEDETRRLARSILEKKSDGVIALHGNLGAGKTCFVNGLAEALHTREAVASPTFVYCREYHGDKLLIHADAYRLESVPEYETDYWAQLFESDGVVAVEWAERLGGLLPKSAVHCFSEVVSENTRRWTHFKTRAEGE
ncbi:MAG: 5-formyltetrahydrofolate cyclo-ligase [Candidatus Hinthialibacter antarcticus]|nr:5-formyltetrahydrofolate cyclo-ligase [Candidatus Hinthialibacter antarcticus]